MTKTKPKPVAILFPLSFFGNIGSLTPVTGLTAMYGALAAYSALGFSSTPWKSVQSHWYAIVTHFLFQYSKNETAVRLIIMIEIYLYLLLDVDRSLWRISTSDGFLLTCFIIVYLPMFGKGRIMVILVCSILHINMMMDECIYKKWIIIKVKKFNNNNNNNFFWIRKYT